MDAASTPWQPAALGAEFSPQVGEMLQTEHGRRELSSRVRRRDEALRTAVKKHLLALGWTILSRPNAAMLTRLRYKAPDDDNKSYYSLPDLIIDSAAAAHLIVDSDSDSAAAASQLFQQQQHQMIIAAATKNNEPPPPPPQTNKDSSSSSSREQEEGDDDHDYTEVEEEEDDDLIEPAEEEEHDDAHNQDQEKDAVIAEYIALMATNDRARGRRANRLRDSAKRQLLAAGWTFWMKLKSNGREELRYRAPTGRSYVSLHTACQAFNFKSSGGSSKMDRRRRVRVQAHATTPAAILRASSSSRVGDEDGGASHSHCRPVVMMRKKRKLSQLMGGDGGDNVTTMKKFECTTIKTKKETTCCQVVGAAGTQQQLIKKKSMSITTTTQLTSRKKKKRRREKASQARVLLRPNSSTAACQQRRSRTLLSVLVDKGIVVPRDKVTTSNKDGFITGEGIRCTCCNKTVTVAEFAAHATTASAAGPPWPWARVFLKDKDGTPTPLSQCLVELLRRDVVGGVAPPRSSGVRVKAKCSDPAGDSVCSICNDGGDLLLCDNCPSAFHHACVGLHDTPDGDWFCPLCRCGVCGGSDFDDAAGAGSGLFFTDRTVIYCDQCEREYHVGCVRRRLAAGSDDEEELQEEEESAAEWCRRLEQQGHWPWLCSPECSKVFQHLQGLAARSIPTAVQGVSLCILRRRRRQQQQQEEEAPEDAAEHGQLCAALDVLHECFVTLIEPRTQTDLAADIVFNRESELRRLNFRGYYVVGLEKAGELITVGTLRVFGTRVAELPLVGTRFAHRRQGMCHLLVTEIHKVLRQAGVRRLVLPAVPELLPMWTSSLGFHPITHSDTMEIAAEHAILSFHGTTMCQKNLLP